MSSYSNDSVIVRGALRKADYEYLFRLLNQGLPPVIVMIVMILTVVMTVPMSIIGTIRRISPHILEL